MFGNRAPTHPVLNAILGITIVTLIGVIVNSVILGVMVGKLNKISAAVGVETASTLKASSPVKSSANGADDCSSTLVNIDVGLDNPYGALTPCETGAAIPIIYGQNIMGGSIVPYLYVINGVTKLVFRVIPADGICPSQIHLSAYSTSTVLTSRPTPGQQCFVDETFLANQCPAEFFVWGDVVAPNSELRIVFHMALTNEQTAYAGCTSVGANDNDVAGWFYYCDLDVKCDAVPPVPPACPPPPPCIPACEPAPPPPPQPPACTGEWSEWTSCACNGNLEGSQTRTLTYADQCHPDVIEIRPCECPACPYDTVTGPCEFADGPVCACSEQVSYVCHPSVGCSCVTPVPVPIPCECPFCNGYLTYTQGGWGSTPPKGTNGTNPGKRLRDGWSAMFCNQMGNNCQNLTIGCGTASITFTNSTAIDMYLPAGGTAGPIASNGQVYSPPYTGLSSNVLLGQLVAAKLNLRYSEKIYGLIDNCTGSLGDLYFTAPLNSALQILNGLTITEIIQRADLNVGKCVDEMNPAIYSILNDALALFNEQFDNGIAKCPRYYAECIQSAPRPCPVL